MHTETFNELANLRARLMGFALAVKDSVDVNRPMTPDVILAALINYATEYETIKAKLNVPTN